MFRKMIGGTSFALTIATALVITACNPNSDAVSVLQSQNTSLQATIASYEALGPTMTAQASAVAQKAASAQAEAATARAQLKELTARMNSGAIQPTPLGAMDSSGAAQTGGAQPGVASNNTNNAAGTNNTAANATGLAFNSVITTRTKGSDGCAAGQANIFSPTDPVIWVVADVRNFKKGTTFTAKWAGGDFTHENDWTVPNDGTQICVHFYIEPKTLGLQPGTYTVTMSAPGITAQQAQFTVQADQAAQSNSGVATDSASGK